MSSFRKLPTVLLFILFTASVLSFRPFPAPKKINLPISHVSLRVATSLPEIPSAIATSLKKASKTLSVGIEYAPAGADQTRGEIETLSMNLRKVSASAIFSSSLEHCKMFVNEQEAAKVRTSVRKLEIVTKAKL